MDCPEVVDDEEFAGVKGDVFFAFGKVKAAFCVECTFTQESFCSCFVV